MKTETATPTAMLGAIEKLRVFGSADLLFDPWLGNFVVNDPATRTWEGFATQLDAERFLLSLQARKIAQNDASRFGL